MKFRLKPFLKGFGVLAVIMTLAPFIAVDYWWIRIFDFPHIELTLLTLAAIAAYFLRFEIKRWQDYAFMTIMLICFGIQFVKIMPYTPLYAKEVQKPTEAVNKNTRLKIMMSNVLQKNTEYQKLIEEMKISDPDVAVFAETDDKWSDELAQGIGERYPYKSEAPLPNTYGMLVYSKLKLIDPRVKYLVDDSIPSIHALIELKSGDTIRMHAIHPTPPMPQHNPTSTDRDAELMKVALEVMDTNIPTVVIGDFNDVAWSQTTRLFKKIGGLLDVRVGRFFYNTFDEGSFVFRWALDHIFVTEEFRVEKIEAGPDVGSDHSHFMAELYLQRELAAEQEPEEKPTEEQIKKAQEQIQEEEKENLEKGDQN